MDVSKDLFPCVFNRLLPKYLSKLTFNGFLLSSPFSDSSNFMMHKHFLTFIAAVLLSLPSIAQTALKSFPAFTDYPVREIYTGKVAPAKTAMGTGQRHPTGGHRPSMFKARLADASTNGQVNFAGHYVLTTWGCGSGGCVEGAVIDALTGDIVWLPLEACCNRRGDDGYHFRADSNLLVLISAVGEDLSAEKSLALDRRIANGETVAFEEFAPQSLIHFYVFNGRTFKEVTSVTASLKNRSFVD